MVLWLGFVGNGRDRRGGRFYGEGLQEIGTHLSPPTLAPGCWMPPFLASELFQVTQAVPNTGIRPFVCPQNEAFLGPCQLWCGGDPPCFPYISGAGLLIYPAKGFWTDPRGFPGPQSLTFWGSQKRQICLSHTIVCIRLLCFRHSAGKKCCHSGSNCNKNLWCCIPQLWHVSCPAQQYVPTWLGVQLTHIVSIVCQGRHHVAVYIAENVHSPFVCLLL